MPLPIVFDLDGTLVDSAPDIHAAVARLLRAEGIAPLDLATVRGFIGNGVPMLIARVIAACGRPADPPQQARWEARFLAEYEGAAADRTRPYPGAAAALRRLARRGHPLGLCTNKPEVPARAVLVAFGLAPLFPVVIGGDSLPVRKPDPAPLRAAAARLGSGAALFVGDSEVDAETAAAAGLPFLLFTGGYRRGPAEGIPAAARFADWADLPGLVAARATPPAR